MRYILVLRDHFNTRPGVGVVRDSAPAQLSDVIEPAQAFAQVPAGRSSARPRRARLILQPRKGWEALNLREIWAYRDLLWILTAREVKLRYKQTALGVVWAVLPPLLAAAIFAVIFGRFARMPSDGVSYLLFVFAGLVAWNCFSGAVQRASGSLVANAPLISKAYFPRLLMPLAHTLSVLVDFAVMLAVLLGMMVYYSTPLTWRVILLPLILLLIILTATGVNLWLSALAVQYRDFVYLVPFLVQVWMFASPVVYAGSIVPERWRAFYGLNPAVGFIEGFRWAILGRGGWSAGLGLTATLVALFVFVSGAFFFRRVERGFADVS